MVTRKKTVLPRRKAAPVHIMPDVAALVAVLQAHALGEYDMTATQVNVALSLLKIYATKPHMTDDNAAPACSHEDALQQLS